MKNPNDVFQITPCTIQITLEDFHDGNADLIVNETCKETFVVLPQYFSPSEAVRMPEIFPQFENHASSLIFIANKTSSYVSRIIVENYPNSHLIVIAND